MGEWHSKTADEVLKEFSTTITGLTPDEVQMRQRTYGFNEIKDDKKESAFKILLKQFNSFIIWLLSASAIISYMIGQELEFYVIIAIILFVIILGFFMEYKAARDMEALIKLAPRICAVIRNGNKITIPSREIVPGDILFLTRGYTAGADARIIDCNTLTIDESTLTGESNPVLKELNALPKDTLLAEQKNMLFSGTHVVNGNGLAVVVSTGQNTQFGHISKMLQNIKYQVTPLQTRLDKLSRQISYFSIFFAVIAFFFGIIHGHMWATMLVFGMAIIVSGIPESLPTVVAVTLAAGIKRMSKQNAIIKNLSSVETLGSCTVICTDKTGTLTQNKMVIESIYIYNSQINVTGSGYVPDGLFLKENEQVDVKNHKTLSKILEIGVLCNNSDIKQQDGEWVIDGEPTEAALIVLARKAGLVKGEDYKNFERKKEHPFDSQRKMMSTVHVYDKKNFVYTKGAPEMLLQKAKYFLHEGEIKVLTSRAKELFLQKNAEYAAHGLRVLGLAFKEHSGSMNIDDIESRLVFVGLVSIRDPLVVGAKDAVMQCEEAGIKVVMITGDNAETAKSIAKEVGIYNEMDKLLTGKELDALSDQDFEKVIEHVTVYARATPAHKLRIVEMFQKIGHIVAMTGDGVNDAPALKKAEIGVAMGVGGSEVAKESAELILKDNNFTTIVKAVEGGRTIYENIRKFIYYMLTSSIATVLIILLAIVIGTSLPLTALMILFINLVTSDFPSMGLGLETSTKDIMKQKPRNPKEGILNYFLIARTLEALPILVLTPVALYMWEMFTTGDHVKAQTIVFATVIISQIFHVFNAKSWNHSVFNRQIFSNRILVISVIISILSTLMLIYIPYFQPIFGTEALVLKDWLLIIPVSSAILLFVEAKKLILKIEINEYEKNHNNHPNSQ